jgi:hypothetical protein
VVWSMSWIPPSLTLFMIFCITAPIQASAFSVGWMNLKVGCGPSFFPHWGRYHPMS